MKADWFMMIERKINGYIWNKELIKIEDYNDFYELRRKIVGHFFEIGIFLMC